MKIVILALAILMAVPAFAKPASFQHEHRSGVRTAVYKHGLRPLGKGVFKLAKFLVS